MENMHGAGRITLPVGLGAGVPTRTPESWVWLESLTSIHLVFEGHSFSPWDVVLQLGLQRSDGCRSHRHWEALLDLYNQWCIIPDQSLQLCDQ